MSDKKQYMVFDPLSHNGRDYKSGDKIRLTDKEAAALLSLRVVAPESVADKTPTDPPAHTKGQGKTGDPDLGAGDGKQDDDSDPGADPENENTGSDPDPEKIFDDAVSAGIIERNGNWHSYDGKTLGNGRNAALAAFLEAGLVAEITQKLNT